jgi:dimethylargininase
MSFTRAIVRHPGQNFASGLSSAGAGPPDVARASAQHRGYCDALEDCGLKLTCLEADPAYPDGTFVEDAAIVTDRGAVITRPGAPSRRGEVDSVAACLREFYPHVPHILAPGTLDGGDVCDADGHFLIGVSARTNEPGAQQLAEHLRRLDYAASIIDIRRAPALLHLKTGIAYLGDGVWVIAEGIGSILQSCIALSPDQLITVGADEAYAANCVRVNHAVLMPEGSPRLAAALRDRGFRPRLLDMSEFRKMDGGPSCLSLRF